MNTAPGHALADLPADAPHPDHTGLLSLFGQFVGTWDMDVRFHDEDGTLLSRRPGTWSFGWVLDGRAVQDVLTYPRTDGPGAGAPGVRGIGTSLRFPDPATGTWHVYWLGAVTGVTVVLHGGGDGRDILLESEPETDGTLNRWRFTDISADAFRWTGHASTDGGRTWWLNQEMLATRSKAG
ncbi:hypothetical protein [Streptomyces sp. RFCAC02]|uniref:hypothetical protein n=1 Tax=Streptomyces sp. RFCAC02 TaxID=2499143 RepID=UPI0010200A42|nr:hypothetical protein [Streptomyces sp. RFCAC02]